ncbi:MAG: hypothetical protein ACRDUV_18195 [Pseudonocardiaceae bacterium]
MSSPREPAQNPRRTGVGSHVAVGRYRRCRRPTPPTGTEAAPISVIAGAVLAVAALVVFDVALTERLSQFFDLGFVVVGLCAAVVVGENGFFAVGVLPPLLLGVLVAVLAALDPATLTATHLPLVATWLTGLAHHVTALVTTHALVLTALALRTALRTARRGAPRGTAARHRTGRRWSAIPFAAPWRGWTLSPDRPSVQWAQHSRRGST